MRLTRSRRQGAHRRFWLSAAVTCCLTAATAVAEEAVAPACLDELSDFATARGLAFDPAEATFAPRWAGAGHEIRRLPGLVARFPIEHCTGTLAVDLGADCKVVKSRGEGGCRRAFPLTFH